MSEQPNDSKDDLIQRLLAREIDLDHPEVREGCGDPEFQERLDGTLEVLAGLDQEAVLAKARADDQKGARDPDPTPWVREGLSRRRARARWRGLAGALSVAAAIVLAVFLAGPREDAVPPSIAPIALGHGELECLAPRGQEADFSRFEWANDAEGGSYEVLVYGPDGRPVDGGASGPLGDVRSWSPDPALAGGWASPIEWELRWRRPGGGKPEVVFAEAAR